MQIEHALLYPALTIGTFLASAFLYEKSGKVAILQPVLIAIVALSALLILLGIPYDEYKKDMVIFQVLLTPAIIALAVPLYENLRKAQEFLSVLIITIVAGGSFILLGAVGLAHFAGLEAPYLLPMTTKSVSAPIAISIAEQTDALIALTILGVFSTGLPGAVITPSLMKWLRIEQDEIRGLVLGMTSHAFGIARSVEISSRATAFATLGMGLMGCFVALVVPTLVTLMGL